jgi:hypothetical protein
LTITDASSQNAKIKRLRIEVTEAGKFKKEDTSFLDLDEVESLSKALTYMMELSEKWKGTNRPYTEVVFSTRGSFQIGFYHKGERIGGLPL